MKRLNPVAPLLLGLTLTAFSAAAAGRGVVPVPVRSTTTPGEVTEQAASPEKPAGIIDKFIISEANLGQVVETLQHQLNERNLPRLNILLPSGAENFPVPPVELYNVTGPDALLLIAAAAGLEAKPIQTEEPAQAAGRGTPTKPRIIGYRIEKKVDPRAEQAKARKDVVETVSVVTPNKKDAEKPTVRVYPLNPIIKGGPVDQLQQSVDEILQMSGVDNSQVKISFHDKTNLLVVRGPDSIHRMVTELLEALEKNSLQTMPSHLPSPVTKDIPPPVIPGSGATAPIEQH